MVLSVVIVGGDFSDLGMTMVLMLALPVLYHFRLLSKSEPRWSFGAALYMCFVPSALLLSFGNPYVFMTLVAMPSGILFSFLSEENAFMASIIANIFICAAVFSLIPASVKSEAKTPRLSSILPGRDTNITSRPSWLRGALIYVALSIFLVPWMFISPILGFPATFLLRFLHIIDLVVFISGGSEEAGPNYVLIDILTTGLIVVINAVFYGFLGAFLARWRTKQEERGEFER